MWPVSEFSVQRWNATPACNWESTQSGRMIVAQMSTALHPECARAVVSLCSARQSARETEEGGDSRRVGLSNEKLSAQRMYSDLSILKKQNKRTILSNQISAD